MGVREGEREREREREKIDLMGQQLMGQKGRYSISHGEEVTPIANVECYAFVGFV